jgi:hypothetical protein
LVRNRRALYLTVAIALKAVEALPGQACDKCETLEDRMAHGPLSLDDTLGIDRQVADGLEAVPRGWRNYRPGAKSVVTRKRR